MEILDGFGDLIQWRGNNAGTVETVRMRVGVLSQVSQLL